LAATDAVQLRLVLSESRFLRYLTLALFYVSQGVPAGVTIIGIPAWAAASGASAETVGSLVAAAYLVPSFKFLIGPLVDRYGFLPMGKRRPWLIGAQGVMTAAWLAAALLAPGPTDTALLVGITFLVSGATAVQDVAADGLAVDLLQEGEEGPAGAYTFGSAIISMAASGAASGYLLQHYGPQAAFLAFLPVIALVTVFAVLVIERPGERRWPWSAGQPSPDAQHSKPERWVPLMREVLHQIVKRDSLIYVASVVAIGLAAGMSTPMWTLYATNLAGFDAASFTALNSAIALPATGIGILLIGFLSPRFGARNLLAAMVLGQAAVVMFAGFDPLFFTTTAAFTALMVADGSFSPMRQMNQQAIRMALSESKVGATQMTVYNSLGNFPLSGGAALFAMLGGLTALSFILWTMAGLYALGIAFVLMLRIGRRVPAPVLEATLHE
jgi:PAT family beta-lactamase induction signal transducer AmpG